MNLTTDEVSEVAESFSTVNSSTSFIWVTEIWKKGNRKGHKVKCCKNIMKLIRKNLKKRTSEKEVLHKFSVFSSNARKYGPE